MPKRSAGILMYRFREGQVEFFLVHPGGPIWARKDLGAWTIPKGLFEDDEDPLAAARREFNEETGYSVDGEFIPLTERKQPGGKIVYAWAVEGDCDAATIKSNLFKMEWPPRSGKWASFPEVDRADWFKIDAAREKILKGQAGFIDELIQILGESQG